MAFSTNNNNNGSIGFSTLLKGTIILFLTAIVLVVWIGSTNKEPITKDDSQDVTQENPYKKQITPPLSSVPGLEISPIPTSAPNTNPPLTSSSPPVKLEPSNYSKTPARKSFLSEVVFGNESLKKLVSKGWDGDPENISLDLSEYPQSMLQKIYTNEQERKSAFTIPQEIREIYVPDQAQQEILSLIKTARKEYIDYLKLKGVNSKYINKIHVVFPEDDSHISTDNIPDATGPISETKDHRGANGLPTGDGTLDMHISIANIHNDARILLASGILGADSSMEIYKIARDMGVRRQVYHEMTHVLQNAYEKVHEDEGDYSSRLYDLEKEYFLHWGEDEVKSSNWTNWRNADIGRERQAEGVSFQVFTWRYALSQNQANVVWDYLFGRLSDAQSLLAEMVTVFETKYPSYNPDSFGTDLLNHVNISSEQSVTNRDTLRAIMTRLLGMPAYLGYLNPMSVDDSSDFWLELNK